MSYNISVKKIDTYLYVTVSGKETYENVVSVWRTIAEACHQHNCKKVLCGGILEGPGPTIDIYDFEKHFHELGVPAGAKIAMVCKKEDLPKMQFAENVVATRATVTSKIFFTHKNAEEWLTKEDSV